MVANNLALISTLPQFPSQVILQDITKTEDLDKTLVTGKNPASFVKIVYHWQDLGIASGHS